MNINIFAMFKYSVIVIIFYLKVTVCFSQTLNYEDNTIYLVCGGYIENEIKYPIGAFGNKLKKEIITSPQAFSIFNKYQKKRKGIFACNIVLITSFILAPTIENTPLRWGVFLSGTLAGAITIPLRKSAFDDLSKSIWLRNGYVMSH